MAPVWSQVVSVIGPAQSIAVVGAEAMGPSASPSEATTSQVQTCPPLIADPGMVSPGSVVVVVSV